MDKEVVVTADVDEEEEFLYKVFKFVNLLWLYGLILGETLEEARKISLDQGCHEHEVSCGGEGDLHRLCLSCKKNPGHRQFIPVRDFKMEHLPLSHRNNVIYEWIRASADLTCRLKVEYTSERRPTVYRRHQQYVKYPFSNVRGNFMRTGTGFLRKLIKYTAKDNKNCCCDECKRPGTHTPHKVWGVIFICTAKHVVFDDDEARRTTCYFGYDTKTTFLPRCLKLTGLKVETNYSAQDKCQMTYITHDMDIINKLVKMMCQNAAVQKTLMVKYGENNNTSMAASCPIVIISHPHGESKHVTVGMSTYRHEFIGTIYKQKLKDGREFREHLTYYKYNTHTCPGSSGAPVFRLPEKGKSWMMFPHYHSEGGEENNNNNRSVIISEIIKPAYYPEQTESPVQLASKTAKSTNTCKITFYNRFDRPLKNKRSLNLLDLVDMSYTTRGEFFVESKSDE